MGEVGEKLGKRTMAKYMSRFGFDAQPPVDLPPERAAGRAASTGRQADPRRRARVVDVGRMAIGQDKLNVTPLQMAMVAAAVANGGRLMEPHLADRIVDRDGRTVDRHPAARVSRVMSAQRPARSRR